MSTIRTLVLIPILALAACADSPDGDGAPDGYVRFAPEPITVQPGESTQWVQYVANPFDQDMDIVDIVGDQGPGGHHALLFSSPNLEDIGFTRESSTLDQVTDRFLGGVGGDSGAEANLPEGAVFRVPAGQALYLNVHYLNATLSPIDGWSQLDVKFAPASEDRTAVALFTNITLGFDAAANAITEATVGCTLERDITMVMFANHMHEYGQSVKTTVKMPGDEDAEPIVLKDDPDWSYEWATNPNFERRSVAEPQVIPAGSRIETRCTWNNTTGDNLMFPYEMCLFLAFDIDGVGDTNCVDGEFNSGGE